MCKNIKWTLKKTFAIIFCKSADSKKHLFNFFLKLKTNLILKFQDKALAKIASFKTVVLTKIDKPEQILIVQQNLLQPTKICFW